MNQAYAEELYDALQELGRNRRLWFDDPDDMVLRCHLAFTILVPGGRARNAASVVRDLERDGYLTRGALPVMPQWWGDNAAHLIRFPRQKYERLVAAFIQYPDIVKTVLDNIEAPVRRLRKELMAMVPGFGLKAAAHFMRNTGLQSMDTEFVPIPDTHVAKFMKMTGQKPWKIGEAYMEVCEAEGLNPMLMDAMLWCRYSRTTDPVSLDFGNFEGV